LWVVFANVAQHHLVHVYKYLLITPRAVFRNLRPESEK
jgi:hypothetical protein